MTASELDVLNELADGHGLERAGLVRKALEVVIARPELLGKPVQDSAGVTATSAGMTAVELIEARRWPRNVNKLLRRVETRLQTNYQRTAYNFLVDFLECPEWFGSHEGGRLVLLSLEVLLGVSARSNHSTSRAQM